MHPCTNTCLAGNPLNMKSDAAVTHGSTCCAECIPGGMSQLSGLLPPNLESDVAICSTKNNNKVLIRHSSRSACEACSCCTTCAAYNHQHLPVACCQQTCSPHHSTTSVSGTLAELHDVRYELHTHYTPRQTEYVMVLCFGVCCL